MQTSRITCACIILVGLSTATAQAVWMQFAGGPAVAIGTWPGGNAYVGTATVTASNFVNGNVNTPAIGITPSNIPNLSPDYFATGLIPNPGPSVSSIATPYNDAGDKYHVVIDFSGMSSGAGAGFLPAGSEFAILDLDIQEDYRKVSATDPANNPIATPWFGVTGGPNVWFDMNLPMLTQGAIGASPTLAGPVLGVYDMFGIAWNFDVGMWRFTTTQSVRTISFDMSKSTGNNAIGGGAGWAFYTPPVPEPTSAALIGCGLLGAAVPFIRRRR